MKKVLVIAGPTAVGKTAFGIRCAESFSGEIISGDSIQVYRGLDIGSAKADGEERGRAVHHLLDIRDPKEAYNVKDFQTEARNAIDDISGRGKLPIIVGGTGLYQKAALYDYVFLEEAEEDKLFEELSNEEIYAILKERDPRSLDKIHINNRKRLVRALNILEKHDTSISEIKDSQEHKCLYDAFFVGLTVPRDVLYQRIERRVDKMLEDGLLDEIRNLLDRGVTFDDRSMSGIGYKEFRGYFEKTETLEECRNNVIRNSKHFAKRQYTWFNHQLPIKWYEDQDLAFADIEEWIGR